MATVTATPVTPVKPRKAPVRKVAVDTLPPVRLSLPEYILVLLSARDKRIENRAQKRAARRKLRDARVIAVLGAAKVGTFMGRTVKAVDSSNSSIDQKLLATIAPEVYTLTRVVTPYTYLKLSK